MIENSYMVQNEAVFFGSAFFAGRVLISCGAQPSSPKVGCKRESNLFGLLPAIGSANTVELGSKRRLTLLHDVASGGA